ncbi:MAG: PAS domain S-box protein [Cyclobacteriaceae bacterium]|nr:PAS domain S-box protein [Cyclobacteriaceae bacterium]
MRKIKILHLEDVKSDADQINRILKKSNIEFESKLVDTRKEFVEALTSYQPEIILSDHSLPTFNSLEAMDELLKHQKKIPFILVTGAVSEEFAAIAMKKGADDYILKDRLQRLPSAVISAIKNYDAEQQQQYAIKQLKNISEYSEDVICSFDGEGKFKYVSAAAERIWGYKPEVLIGTSFYNLVCNEDIEATKTVARQIIAGTSVSTYENRCIRKDGTIIPIIWSSKWEEKEKTMFTIGKDATEHVLARKKLEESKRQYVHLVENLPKATYTCDAEGRIILYNPACVNLWGRHPDLNKDLWCGSWKILDQKNNPMPVGDCPMARAIKEGRAIRGEEIIIQRPDGSKRIVLPYPSPQFDESGVVTGAINVLVDITDRKAIEEENHKLALIARVTVNAVVVTDIEGRITWVNNGFERITEYSMEEVIGQKPGDLLQGKYTDPATILHMRKCRQEGREFRVEILNYTKSGKEYWLDIEVMPLKDHRQKLIGFMAIQQDITERKRSEVETQNMIGRLQSINRDLRQFSYIASHNLRAPIARILGLANLLNIDMEDRQICIDRIAQETISLDMVVKDINQVISAHDTKVEKLSEVNMSLMYQSVMTTLKKEIHTSNAIVNPNFDNAPVISSVGTYVFNMLFHLISNSLKFRSENTIPRINVTSSQDRDCNYIVVEDNGLGVDLKIHRQKLFDLYQKFHGDRYPGRGMGLNLIRAQAEALGGGIEVESEVGKGSKFTIYLRKNKK